MSRKRNVTVAAVQMKCSTHVEENIAKADALVREAAEKGAQIILLPELFERQYFCQERRYEYYEFAKKVNENDAVKYFSALAKELSVVIPVSQHTRFMSVQQTCKHFTGHPQRSQKNQIRRFHAPDQY